MRKTPPLQKASFPAPDVVTKVVPSPTDGWDAISPLAVMDPKRAPILDNWVPRAGWVEVRGGYETWCLTNSGAAVETLMVRRSAGGVEKLFAATDAHFYDVSTLGLTPTSVVAGNSNARWQYVNFTPALGNTYLFAVNGADSMWQYDGTSWTNPSITGLPGGLGTQSISNIAVQGRRLWFCLNNGSSQGTTVAAFMPPDTISGAIAGTLDTGALWNKGGFMIAIAEWAVDGGNGPQTYAIFISNRGQVAVYQGTDPTTSNNWALVGIFDLAPPIGYRCLTRTGSDLAVITQQGVIPLSQALPFDPSADRSVAITSRIQNAMANAAATYASNFGWQFITYPAQNLAILNVPVSTNTQQQQYVMNTITGAWCRFVGWNANCFEIYQDKLYFGDNNGNVNLAYSGSSDGPVTTINADMQCAYNYFDDPGRIKRVTMVQPLLTAGGTVFPKLSVDEDFILSNNTAPITLIQGGALWDTAIWNQSVWPNTTVTLSSFFSVQALGHALAVHMTVNIAPTSGNSFAGQFDITVFDTAVFDFSMGGAVPALQVNAFNAIMEMGSLV